MFYKSEDLSCMINSNLKTFNYLDIHFNNKRNIKDKNNYLKLKSEISQLISQLEDFIFYDVKEKNHDEITSNIEFFFIKIATLKDKYLDLAALYENRKIKDDKYHIENISEEIYNLKNFLWYESTRKTRNNITHENIKPIIKNINGKLWFNYFHVINGEKTTIPFIYFHNSRDSLVKFDLYAGCVLHCLILLISGIGSETIMKPVINIDITTSKFRRLLEEVFNLDYSETENQNRLFFGMYGCKKEEIKNTLSIYENHKFNLVDEIFIAGLYLSQGHKLTQENNYQDAMISFKKSLELNYDLAQVSNIIGASSSIDTNSNSVVDFIKENTSNALKNKYINFFLNAGNYLSEFNQEFAENIFSAGYAFVNENQESVDFIYNYAHFMKNNKNDHYSALKLCLEILKISPIDKGAHKMILNIYAITNQHYNIKKHITKHLPNIEDGELKQHLECYLK